MNNKIESEIRDLLKQLDELFLFASKNLLKSNKFYDTKERIEIRLKSLSKDLGEMEQLAIEKIIPRFRNNYKSDIFLPPDIVNEISPLRGLLFELLAKYGKVQTLPTPMNEHVITGGNPYEGKKYLRSILNLATISIYIIDNYLRPEILDILSEYIIDKPQLNIRLMLSKNSGLPAFCVNYCSFIAQYPDSIQAKYLSNEQKDHPRYILIDDIKLFNPDHSLDQWGTKTVNIHEHTDPKVIKKVQQDLEQKWGTAKDLEC